MLHLVTLGDAAVETGSARIDTSTPHPLLAALYVVRARGRRVTRDALCDLLWPGDSREVQRPRLRVLLHRLRRLGVPLEMSTQEVALESVQITADYEQLPSPDALLADAALARHIALVLPFDPRALPAFADWLDEQRSDIARGVTRALVAAMTAGRARGEWAGVERCAEACRRVDPLNEEAHLALAEALCMTASKERALAVLDEYEAQLGEHRQLRLPARLLRERIEHAATRPLVGESAVDAPFVGRGDAKQQLLEALDGTRRGAGGGRVVWGPAGIGKSRLLTETAREVALRGVATVSVRCQPGDSLRPLSVLFDLVPLLLELPGALGCERSTLDELRTLPSSSEATVLLSAAEGAARRAKVQLALLDLLDAVSGEEPLVVVVDDVQWMDEGMEQLWNGILPWSATHPVLWLFGCRAERRDELRKLPLGAEVSAIALAPLDAHAAAELVDVLIEPLPRTTPEARDAIVTLGGGSPLLLRELVRHYAETGRIDTLPASIAPVISGRLDRLNPSALRVFQATALLGTRATAERVGAIVGLPRGELLDALVTLLDAGVLEEDAAGLLHGHALWCDAALARLQPALGRVLHRHAAEWLESELERAASSGLLWDCARHWREAGNASRALDAVVRGAEQLVAHGFFRDAAGVYARAASEATVPRQRLSLLHRRMQLLKLAGNWPEHIAAVDDHEGLAAEVDPAYDVHNDFELARVGSLVEATSDHVLGVERLMECARAPDASVLHRLRAVRGAVFHGDRSGRHSLMAEAARIAAALPVATLDERREARLTLVRYHTSEGDLDVAADVGEDWIAEERGQADGEGDENLQMAMRISWDAFLNAGRLDRAWTIAREMVDIAKRKVNAAPIRSAIDVMLVMCLEFDRLDEAERWIGMLSALPEVTTSAASVVERIFAPMYRMDLAIRRGDGAEAVRVAPPLDECLKVPVGARFHGRFVGAHLGAQLLAGNDVEARRLAALMGGYFTRPDRWMDLPATMYARALRRFEGQAAAAAFVARYLGELRRERYRPPDELQRLLDAHPPGRRLEDERDIVVGSR